jgi:hypothetical protein
MKNTIIFVVLSVFTLSACGSNSNEMNHNKDQQQHHEAQYTCPMHPEVTGNKGDECGKCGMELTEPVQATSAHMDNMEHHEHADEMHAVKEATVIDPLISQYITLKNAFTKDDVTNVVKATKLFVHQLAEVNASELIGSEKEIFTKQTKSILSGLENILANSTNIEKQRTSFETISISMLVLVEKFGSKQALYQEFCPMYNNDRGGMWLSESKDILNPYFGSKMLKCGVVKKQL